MTQGPSAYQFNVTPKKNPSQYLNAADSVETLPIHQRSIAGIGVMAKPPSISYNLVNSTKKKVVDPVFNLQTTSLTNVYGELMPSKQKSVSPTGN